MRVLGQRGWGLEMAGGFDGAVGVVVVLVLGAAAGCTGGDKTNGLEGKPAVEVQQTAVAALEEAGSVHVTGELLSRGRPVQLDLLVTGNSSSGTLTLEDSQVDIVTVGSEFYLKSDQTGWQDLEAPAPVAGYAGRWVKLGTRHVNVDVVDLKFLVERIAGEAWQEAKVEQSAMNDTKVVALNRPDGARLDIANVGPGYPLRLDDRPHGVHLDFTEHGADVQIAAPGDALSNALSDAELAWLEATTSTLMDTMNAVFDTVPEFLDSTVLTAFADQLRTCSRELARIGPPGDRLEPVHALVKQACAQYDVGAECVATAAAIGIPLAGSDEARRYEEAIKCGFDSSAAISVFGNALNKGNEIKAQLS